MQRIFSNIHKAVKYSHDRQARWNMVMGSLEGALCLNLDYLGEKAQKIADFCGAPSILKLPEKMSNLVEELGIPLRLRNLGLGRAKLNGVAQAAMLDNANKTNPRLMTVDLYEALLARAY
jgi:alcohol dehydrogenase class IV